MTSEQIIRNLAGQGICDGHLSTNAPVNPSDCAFLDEEMLIADATNHRIRKVFTNGTIVTIAGNGFAGYNGDGLDATSAQLNNPVGIYVDTNSREVYIADSNNHRIRKILQNGKITTIAGTGIAGYNGDDKSADSAQLNTPSGIVIDPNNGEIFISDSKNHRIRKILQNGKITTIAGTGEAGYNGDGIEAKFAKLYLPNGIDLYEKELFIADQNNHRIRKVSLDTGLISTIAGNGNSGYNGDNILATNCKLSLPAGVRYDSKRREVYIADSNNQRIRKILESGIIVTIAGTGEAGFDNILNATQSKVNHPNSVTLNELGEVFISDSQNYRVRKITTESGIITTIVGNGFEKYCTDLASNTPLFYPRGIISNENGEFFYADSSNHCIRKILTNGTILTIAGTGTKGYNGDGIEATSAQLNTPHDVALNLATGEIYIADTENNRIRKILTNGTITTIAGTGDYGYNGDGIMAVDAWLNEPSGVEIDSTSGEVFFSDTENFRIRRVSNSGIITTIAGTGKSKFNGDGMATDTNLATPTEIQYVPSTTEIYFADSGNNRIRKFTINGMMTTIAGTSTSGYNGDNMPATRAWLNFPVGVTYDPKTNQVYIADLSNHRIRKILTNGTITTIAGTGKGGYNGNNLTALSTQVNGPHGMILQPNGDVIFSDSTNNVIRIIRSDQIYCNGTLSSDLNVCNGRGWCMESGKCSCQDGWIGDYCSEPTCENDCYGHGRCVSNNTCECEYGWDGNSHCSQFSCGGLNNCNSNGLCVSNNTCSCQSGWAGTDCSQFTCSGASNCSDHGSCISNNTCHCNSGWKGNAQCSQFTCELTNDCSNHGLCVSNNTCQCSSGWNFINCSIKECLISIVSGSRELICGNDNSSGQLKTFSRITTPVIETTSFELNENQHVNVDIGSRIMNLDLSQDKYFITSSWTNSNNLFFTNVSNLLIQNSGSSLIQAELSTKIKYSFTHHSNLDIMSFNYNCLRFDILSHLWTNQSITTSISPQTNSITCTTIFISSVVVQRTLIPSPSISPKHSSNPFPSISHENSIPLPSDETITLNIQPGESILYQITLPSMKRLSLSCKTISGRDLNLFIGENFKPSYEMYSKVMNSNQEMDFENWKSIYQVFYIRVQGLKDSTTQFTIRASISQLRQVNSSSGARNDNYTIGLIVSSVISLLLLIITILTVLSCVFYWRKKRKLMEETRTKLLSTPNSLQYSPHQPYEMEEA
ncbi:predicted protein [Naegleria gruberi]|uniref:Predicted protein n=1 Tax=Naegleria gruberi TaxID=5762 RepID=D2VUT7_NAEGR|nr:uncharacterized protein NAEGRDRAFT_72780 [Naegleria gruberi]EFC39316.1 predicted protein [Naegleria gruberi]|eukprot:XP_002672060.1 predicted protein [Naegleria gruberi strain NEG-M]